MRLALSQLVRPLWNNLAPFGCASEGIGIHVVVYLSMSFFPLVDHQATSGFLTRVFRHTVDADEKFSVRTRNSHRKYIKTVYN